MTTVPKLSEAILQGYNEAAESGFRFTNLSWLDREDDPARGDRCAGCALGLAFYAMKHKRVVEPYTLLLRYWPWTIDYWVGEMPFAGIITQKFEDVLQGRSTMEDLIEWVQSIEPKEKAAVTPEPVLVACEV